MACGMVYFKEWNDRPCPYQPEEVHDGVDEEHEDEGAEVVAAEEDGDRADHHLGRSLSQQLQDGLTVSSCRSFSQQL